MDFSLSEEHQLFQKNFSRFCADKIAPRAKEADRTGVLPRENWADLTAFGYLALYDDANATDIFIRCIAEEELAKHCAATFLSVGASLGLFGRPVQAFGTDEQKARFLRPVLNGEKIGCFGLTEPSAGSDAAAIKTSAREVEGGWLLNGEKALITNAPIADYAVICAVTESSAGYGGFSAFVVDLNAPGVKRTAPYSKMGLRASPTGGLIFEDVKLTPENLLHGTGEGWAQVMSTLEWGRVGMCHFGIGIAEAAYESSLDYASTRKAFGRPIAHKQAIQNKLTDMRIKIDGARLMARKVAWLKSNGEPCSELASVAKLFATEMATEVTDEAVQIHGGWGYTDEYVVDRLFRDARLGTIGEGTSEIQRELIARSLLGF
jgi:alkylation response protein AidB-like acyl-CoA dehydrogenase